MSPLSPSPAPDGGARFFQRAIVGWTTRIVRGVECVDRVRLSCGHWRTYTRFAPVAKNRKSAPCRECGSGFRQASDQRRARARLEVVLREAIETPHRLDALLGFIETALQVRTLHPTTEAEEQLYEDLTKRASLAGLLGLPREEELEDLDLSATSGRGRMGLRGAAPQIPNPARRTSS